MIFVEIDESWVGFRSEDNESEDYYVAALRTAAAELLKVDEAEVCIRLVGRRGRERFRPSALVLGHYRPWISPINSNGYSLDADSTMTLARIYEDLIIRGSSGFEERPGRAP